MKRNIKKMKKICYYLFQFYQRGYFNRLNFWLFKKRQAGLEKIAELILSGRRPNKVKCKYRNQQQWAQWIRRKKKMQQRWKKINEAMKKEKEEKEKGRKKKRKAKRKNKNKTSKQ